jgi:hypothetical protein
MESTEVDSRVRMMGGTGRVMKRKAGGAEERRTQDDGEAAAKPTDEVKEAAGKI